MPIKRCQSDKQKGYKYGDSGHCYTGAGALDKAMTQMKAIKASQSRAKKGK